MSGLIDSTLDELDRQVRELKHELASVEALRRQLASTTVPATDASVIRRKERATQLPG